MLFLRFYFRERERGLLFFFFIIERERGQDTSFHDYYKWW